MKKILCFLLAILMLAGLCGCMGGNNLEDYRDAVFGNNTIPSYTIPSYTIPEPTIPSYTVPQFTTPEATEPEETEPESTLPDNVMPILTDAEFALGKISGQTYNSEFLGISCTIPQDWVFYSEQQILEMNNLVGNYLEEDIAEQIKAANIVYDMFATASTSGSNININMEKLDSAVQLAVLNVREALENQTDDLISTYETIGYTDIQVEYRKVTVDGKDFDGISIRANMMGIDFYGLAFAFKRSSSYEDNYLATVTLSSVVTDDTDTILSYITIE